eukprot:COSAG01_NODE_71904_length_254_cov_1.000000_1_plen_29_part_10
MLLWALIGSRRCAELMICPPRGVAWRGVA